jgi:hypothetical protein
MSMKMASRLAADNYLVSLFDMMLIESQAGLIPSVRIDGQTFIIQYT